MGSVLLIASPQLSTIVVMNMWNMSKATLRRYVSQIAKCVSCVDLCGCESAADLSLRDRSLVVSALGSPHSFTLASAY